MVATFMDLMDSTITNVALPAISATLEATPAQLEWTLAGYVIALATPWPRVADGVPPIGYGHRGSATAPNNSAGVRA